MNPVSILRTLSVTPTGAFSIPLDLGELSQYLQKQLGTEENKQRNARHALRDDLYRDGGVSAMKAVIERVFQDPLVQDLRKRWVEHARFNNALKRIVNELSTVYAEPAKRTVSGEADQKRYQDLLDGISMDEQMLQMSRLLNLHRAMLIGFRVRERPDGSREPVIDMASPADVRVLLHPNDNKVPIGWAVRSSHRPARNMFDDRVPKWTLWTDVERVQLRDDFSIIPGTYVQHGLGVNPWVPVLLGPMPAGFWPGEEGEDLVAAHIAIWLSNVFLLKESKSATKQPVIRGDGTNTARGQAADSEVPIEVSDGQSISTVDMSMDLSAFRQTADHILEHAAQNYGMSAALINHQGVQSAEARELMRLPLRELRKHQQAPLRRFEKQFAIVMSKVLESDLPEMGFNADGWRIEFGDAQTPMSKIDEINLFLAGRQAGVDDTVSFIQRQRPGMTPEEAIAEMEQHITVETIRNLLMRPMMQISGGMGAAAPGTPKMGANGGNLDQPGAPVAKLGQQEESAPPEFVSPATFNSSPVPQQRLRGNGGGAKDIESEAKD